MLKEEQNIGSGSSAAEEEGEAARESALSIRETACVETARIVQAARDKARILVNEAEAEAEERIAKVREGLPALKEERRKRRVALFEKEADELREKMSDSTTRMKAAVEAGRRNNLPEKEGLALV